MFTTLAKNNDEKSSKEVFEEISFDLSELRKNIGSAINKCDNSVKELESDKGGFLSDHVWYPDNPKRKKKAISLFKELKQKYLESERLIDKNLINIKDLEDIYITTKSWDSYLQTLTPISETSLLLETQSSETFNFSFINKVIAVNAGGAWKLINWAMNKKGSFGKSSIVVSLAFGFITSIFTGGARKKKFDEMIKEAEKAIKDVEELNNELSSMDKDSRIKFYEISVVLEEGAFVKKGTFTKFFDEKLNVSMDNIHRKEFFDALYNATNEMKIWSNAYTNMLLNMRRRKRDVLSAAEEAAGDLVFSFLAKELGYDTVLDITEEDEIKYEKEIEKYTSEVTKLFVLTHTISEIKNEVEENENLEDDEKIAKLKEKINERADLLELDEENRNYILIRALLINKFNPNEIIEIVDLPKAVIEDKIENIISFDEEVENSDLYVA